MAKKVDPRDFLLNTDFEMDKIVYFKEAELMPDQFGGASISHSLGIAPLVFGVWSKTKDFAIPHAFCEAGFSEPATGKYVVETISCTSTESSINFIQYAGTESTPAPFKFYVRIFGFEPSDSHKNLPKTSFNADTFVLNTDYNYLKLYKKGVENIVIPSQAIAPSAITIKHNLGYRPQALFWVDSEYQGHHEVTQIDILRTAHQENYDGAVTVVPSAGIQSYTDRFVIEPSMPQYGDTHKLHYRIYYDETI